ncbi:hypothetical protein [Streptomyces sp. NPDC048606]|uniref:hypothetical protein n=1 Tax=Streptomyces sp. NPDC048606 TaxID=3154726 RepID=UPI003440D667
MGDTGTWSEGPRTGPEGHAALLTLAERAARTDAPHAPFDVLRLVCRWCEADEFEAAYGELFCFGCCLPMGVPDGVQEGFPGQFPWTLHPSTAPAGSTHCPDGHRVFEVAIARLLTEDHRTRTLTVVLRCPDDGRLHLHVDNARTDIAYARTGDHDTGEGTTALAPSARFGPEGAGEDQRCEPARADAGS